MRLLSLINFRVILYGTLLKEWNNLEILLTAAKRGMNVLHCTSILCLFMLSAASMNNSETTVDKDKISFAGKLTVAAITDSFKSGTLLSHIACKSDAAQSYALYIPRTGNNKPLPAVYFFDPHGDGSLPLIKYKSLADRYRFILIGSNNSKNGNDWPTADHIWNVLLNDTKQRIRIDERRMYTCGFSGGAKVASHIALNHPGIAGVLAGGAALPEATVAGDLKFSFTTIAGEGDMNITDLIAFDNALGKTMTRHRIIFFDGLHEWWPQTTMQNAWAGLQLDAMVSGLTPKDEAFIHEYCDGSRKRIDSYVRANNYIRAEAECRFSVNVLRGVALVAREFIEKDSSLISQLRYKKQWQQRQDILSAEQKTKQLYSQHFQQVDINYWTNTIHDLQRKAKVKTPEGAMNQRLLAYLSLAFYSISNQLINEHRDIEAAYFVNLYKLDDAHNPEAWYFSAILNARTNNAKASMDDLVTAVENGFADRKRLETQSEFQHIPINLAAIEKRMKH